MTTYSECIADRSSKMQSALEKKKEYENELKERNNWVTYYDAVVKYIDAMRPTLKELSDLYDDPECIKITGNKLFDDGAAKANLENAEKIYNDYKTKYDDEIKKRDLARDNYEKAISDYNSAKNISCEYLKEVNYTDYRDKNSKTNEVAVS